ncbi:MAG: hypothetical protein Q3995_05845 [Eubacteriales bacterium]|nr:hypothetical protein [Eubacteriales bacterium]
MSNLLLARNAQMGRHSLLPREYQQVEYIESTGTQWIDTGVIPSTGTKAIYDFCPTTFDGIWRSVLASKIADNQNAFFVSFNASDFTIGFGNNNYRSFSRPSVLSANSRYCVSQDKTGVSVNNIFYPYPFSNKSLSSSLTLGLLCQNISNEHSRNFIGKLYYCQIFDSDILIRHYIPCYRKIDFVVGLYDLVNHTFVQNSGTGVFSIGPILH